jgi:hypothetical protein
MFLRILRPSTHYRPRAPAGSAAREAAPDPRVQALMWERYGEYLASLADAAYRDHVFAYVTKEDTPRPLMFQLDLLRETGFADVEILHKNSVFAAFGAWKRPAPRPNKG